MRVNAVHASREPSRAALVIEALQGAGVSVTAVQRAKEVHSLLAHRGCDLLLVGQKLADEDGVEFVRSLRLKGPAKQLPIVALVEHAEQAPAGASPVKHAYALFGRGTPAAAAAATAAAPAKDRASLRLAFFQAGADECLSLSWDAAECLARIKAVLRRTQASAPEEIVKMGEIELNLTSYTLHVSGKRVPLTSKELDLLYVFLSSANRVLSRPYLIERVWGYNYFGSPRTVDVHVRRLREKLGAAARHITTIPCVGYKLVPPGGELRR
ncbi:MAG: response regulator transcription factor [Elusimicrobia bacterium]|nr:response regulator transcription factor [Elusimicrobiota bacterium]